MVIMGNVIKELCGTDFTLFLNFPSFLYLALLFMQKETIFLKDPNPTQHSPYNYLSYPGFMVLVRTRSKIGITCP